MMGAGNAKKNGMYKTKGLEQVTFLVTKEQLRGVFL